MITPREPEEQLDLRAVVRDDELLDRIAAGVRLADGGDPAVALLQALVRDVDRDLDTAVRQPLPEAEASDSRWLRHRRLTLRGTAAVAVIGLGLSVGGVSAAVTGNPLAAYESVVGVFDSGDELPPTAAEIAKWNKKMVAARASVRAGDSTTAQAQIDALREMIRDLDVSDGHRAALEAKLAKLEQRLESRGPGKSTGERPEKGNDGRTKDKPAGRGDDSTDRPAEPGQAEDRSGPSDQPELDDDGVTAGDPPAEQPPSKDKTTGKGRDRAATSDPGTGPRGTGPAEETVVDSTAPGVPGEDKGAAPGNRGNGRR